MNTLSQRGSHLASMQHVPILRALRASLERRLAASDSAPVLGWDAQTGRLTFDVDAIARDVANERNKHGRSRWELDPPIRVAADPRSVPETCTVFTPADGEQAQREQELHALAAVIHAAVARLATARGQSERDFTRSLTGALDAVSPFGEVAPRAQQELQHRFTTSRQHLTFERRHASPTPPAAVARAAAAAASTAEPPAGPAGPLASRGPLLRWHKATLRIRIPSDAHKQLILGIKRAYEARLRGPDRDDVAAILEAELEEPHDVRVATLLRLLDTDVLGQVKKATQLVYLDMLAAQCDSAAETQAETRRALDDLRRRLHALQAYLNDENRSDAEYDIPCAGQVYNLRTLFAQADAWQDLPIVPLLDGLLGESTDWREGVRTYVFGVRMKLNGRVARYDNISSFGYHLALLRGTYSARPERLLRLVVLYAAVFTQFGDTSFDPAAYVQRVLPALRGVAPGAAAAGGTSSAPVVRGRAVGLSADQAPAAAPAAGAAAGAADAVTADAVTADAVAADGTASAGSSNGGDIDGHIAAVCQRIAASIAGAEPRLDALATGIRRVLKRTAYVDIPTRPVTIAVQPGILEPDLRVVLGEERFLRQVALPERAREALRYIDVLLASPGAIDRRALFTLPAEIAIEDALCYEAEAAPEPCAMRYDIARWSTLPVRLRVDTPAASAEAANPALLPELPPGHTPPAGLDILTRIMATTGATGIGQLAPGSQKQLPMYRRAPARWLIYWEVVVVATYLLLQEVAAATGYGEDELFIGVARLHRDAPQDPDDADGMLAAVGKALAQVLGTDWLTQSQGLRLPAPPAPGRRAPPPESWRVQNAAASLYAPLPKLFTLQPPALPASTAGTVTATAGGATQAAIRPHDDDASHTGYQAHLQQLATVVPRMAIVAVSSRKSDSVRPQAQGGGAGGGAATATATAARAGSPGAVSALSPTAAAYALTTVYGEVVTVEHTQPGQVRVRRGAAFTSTYGSDELYRSPSVIVDQIARLYDAGYRHLVYVAQAPYSRRLHLTRHETTPSGGTGFDAALASAAGGATAGDGADVVWSGAAAGGAATVDDDGDGLFFLSKEIIAACVAGRPDLHIYPVFRDHYAALRLRQPAAKALYIQDVDELRHVVADATQHMAVFLNLFSGDGGLQVHGTASDDEHYHGAVSYATLLNRYGAILNERDLREALIHDASDLHGPNTLKDGLVLGLTLFHLSRYQRSRSDVALKLDPLSDIIGVESVGALALRQHMRPGVRINYLALLAMVRTTTRWRAAPRESRDQGAQAQPRS